MILSPLDSRWTSSCWTNRCFCFAALMLLSVVPLAAELEVVAQRGGGVSAPLVHGDHAYLLQGSSLVTLRLPADKITAPVVTAVSGPLDGFPRGEALHGDRLYVATDGPLTGGAIHVFSLADPSRPARLDDLDLPLGEPLEPRSLAMLGDVLYIESNGKLLSFDLSDPDLPVAGSPTEAGGSSVGVYDEEHLVVWGMSPLLPPSFSASIFDVSAPLAPVAIGAFSNFTGTNHLATGGGSGGGLVVNGTSTGFYVYDVSDPSAPELVAEVDGPSDAGELVGPTYLVGDGDLLRVFDLSEPSSPVELAPVPLGFDTLQSAVLDGDRLAFTANGARAGLMDVSEPRAPVVGPPADLPLGSTIRGVSPIGHQIYVADAERGLQLANAKMAVVADLGSDWPNIAPPSVDGTRALLIDGAAFYLLDVSTADAPVLLGSAPVDGARAPLLDGDRGWGVGGIPSEGWWLVELDLTSPSSPVATVTAEPLPANGTFRLRGETLYAAGHGPDGGLHVFDVSGPAAVKVGHYADCQATGLDVRNGLAALTCPIREEVRLIDVSDSAAPALLGSYSTAGLDEPEAVLFDPDDAGRLYLGYEGGVDVLDVSDPSAPFRSQRLPLAAYIRSLLPASGGGLWATGVIGGIFRIDEAGPGLGAVDKPARSRPFPLHIQSTEGYLP